jgi:acyl-ACP thioesterase
MGPSGYASPQAICRYLQEAAGNHAVKLGFTSEAMTQHGQMWVLSQLSLRMSSYPRGQERILIETWPVYRGSTVRGYRSFTLRDCQGNILGLASSMWLLLNKETRRPLRLPATLAEFVSPGHEPEFLHAPASADFSGAPQAMREFEIRGSDIDWNLHVNNVSYLEWALETLPAEMRLRNKIVELDISFLAEGKYGSSIEAECFAVANEDATFLHKIVERENKQTLALLRTRWQTKA